MTGKHAILGTSVFMLAVANVWYWWPGDNGQENVNYSTSQFHTEAINLDGLRALQLLPISNNQLKRDLFLPVATIVKTIQEVPDEIEQVISKVEKSVPERKNNIVPLDYLARYRLAGIVFKNGERVAYLLDGQTPLVVHAGDNLSQSVIVESISTQTAVVKDSKSGLTRKLVLAGD